MVCHGKEFTILKYSDHGKIKYDWWMELNQWPDGEWSYVKYDIDKKIEFYIDSKPDVIPYSQYGERD